MSRTSTIRITFSKLLAVIAIALSGTLACAQYEGIPEQCFKIVGTDQQSYEKYLKCIVASLEPLDPKKREWYGEKYDPKKYFECRVDKAVNDMSCEEYRLKRFPEPEYWPNAGKVPPMKWPTAPKQSVYRKGMATKEYFDALCKTEAGEFIYKTVEDVEGLYQIRPRFRVSDYALRDRFAMEDPYGFTRWEADDPATLFVNPPVRNFLFFEKPRIDQQTKYWDGKGFERHSGYVGRREARKLIKKPMVIEQSEQLKSRYGFVWRGIKRVRDRELGIAGGELAVVDLNTNEILGLRRGFIYSIVRNREYGVNWENLTVCPVLSDRSGWSKDGDFTAWFVTKVVKPKTQ